MQPTLAVTTALRIVTRPQCSFSACRRDSEGSASPLDSARTATLWVGVLLRNLGRPRGVTGCTRGRRKTSLASHCCRLAAWRGPLVYLQAQEERRCSCHAFPGWLMQGAAQKRGRIWKKGSMHTMLQEL